MPNSSLWEPNFDRVLKVLRRDGEPDRVPFLELIIDMGLAQEIMGQPLPPPNTDEHRRFQIEFMTKMGYDYVGGGHNFGFPKGEHLARLTADTSPERNRGQRGWRNENEGIIATWEDFESYPWPDPAQADFEDLEKIGAMVPDGMKVTTMLPGGVLENTVDLFGYEPLCFALVEQPDLVQAVADRVGALELGLVERICSYDQIGALWINDDLGFKTQTMISPADLRKYIFPWHKKMTAVAHAAGKPVMLHACGNLKGVMEDIIEDVHIDGKHSYEDVIQPVAEFKQKYEGRIAALGGIDVDRLVRDSEADLRAYVRRTIEACAPGGGYALGSGNSIANYVPVNSYLAMLDEGRKVGVYGG
ncbi:MAG TPA: uroporphyrinogen decarboxylase family protein [Armatimonadota bacterium]|jgi:uroporphyrinogen decarboxylase